MHTLLRKGVGTEFKRDSLEWEANGEKEMGEECAHYSEFHWGNTSDAEQ